MPSLDMLRSYETLSDCAYAAFMALDSSAEEPVPVRTVSRMIGEWVGRLGAVWVEGEVANFRPRPGARNQFFALRDLEADFSLKIVVDAGTLGAVDPPVEEGQRIVVWARPEYWGGQGSLQLRARHIRAVGVGELLAQLEKLKGLLAAEGLFSPERKKPIPFIPTRVGLICGRASAAMRDVLHIARERWPAVAFEVREVAVQGASAVPEVIAALNELDAHPDVDVIVIARGGGSVEDLLPFSNETLVRAVAAAHTPIVSAIGHEPDMPIIDFVSDVRASTPTDAAKRIVPSVIEQREIIHHLKTRLHQASGVRIERELHRVEELRTRANRAVQRQISTSRADVGHLFARVRALSPLATLERGYAVVTDQQGQLIRSVSNVTTNSTLNVRVVDGTFVTRVDEIQPEKGAN